MSINKMESDFPDLVEAGYRVTSEATPNYNCIAWALEKDDVVLWPDSMDQFSWPRNFPREEKMEVFIVFFQSFGYMICENESFEPGYEKIALYIDPHGRGSHAAKQLRNGKWTSKLGPDEDIEPNTLAGLAGDKLGVVGKILKRAVA